MYPLKQKVMNSEYFKTLGDSKYKAAVCLQSYDGTLKIIMLEDYKIWV